MTQKKLQVTSLARIKEMAEGEVVSFTGWTDEPFVAKVKQVSMLGLVTQGLIPNTLMSAANQVFNGTSAKKGVDMKETTKIMDIIIGEVLVEPKLSDLTDAGVSLTDQQRMELFNYSQSGVKGLYRFRANQASLANNQSVGNVSSTTKSDSGNK